MSRPRYYLYGRLKAPRSLAFVPGSIADTRFIADVRTEEYPDNPMDPAIARLNYSDAGRVWSRFLIEAAGVSVGFAFSFHDPWQAVPDRVARVGAGFLAGHRSVESFNTAHEYLEEHVRRDGALIAATTVPEHDAVKLEALTQRGYVEDRRERFWELDLREARTRIADLRERSAERMRREGITVVTLAAGEDPDRYARVYAMSAQCELDVPSSHTIVPDSYDDFKEWLASPVIHEDRIFVAMAGDDAVGLSALAYPVERGIVSTDWTCVKREFRNRGIARALKLETIAQAIQLGVDRIRTDNDFRNAPILQLNANLGYRHIYDDLKLKLQL